MPRRIPDITRERILELAAKGTITVEQLSERFNVSKDSVRHMLERAGIEPKKEFQRTMRRDLVRDRAYRAEKRAKRKGKG